MPFDSRCRCYAAAAGADVAARVAWWLYWRSRTATALEHQRRADLAARANVKKLHLFHHDPDQTDDAILCRNTKPLVKIAFNLIKRGIPCHVEGRDIGAGLIKLVDRFEKARSVTSTASGPSTSSGQH